MGQAVVASFEALSHFSSTTKEDHAIFKKDDRTAGENLNSESNE
jgi:molybdopterin synthase catalytic subunit